MEFFEDQRMDVKQRKIRFLGECVYECIKRLHYHAEVPITEELIRLRALEFQDLLQIPGFSPTKTWLNLFKATYNITLSYKKISIHTAPQDSLDINDIMTYCRKVRASKPLLPKCKLNDIKKTKRFRKSPFLNEHEAKRCRNLPFLQEALKEYVLRVKFHYKLMKLDTMTLWQVACDFNEILDVPDFEPTTEWISSFRKQYESEECLANAKRPRLSLNLKHILSYCNHMQKKTKGNTMRLTPNGTGNISESGLKFQQYPIIYLDDEAGETDTKPDIEEIREKKPNVDEPPPLKIRKIESINNDLEQQHKIPANNQIHTTPLVTKDEPLKKQIEQTHKTITYVQKAPARSPNEMCQTDQPNSVKIKEETLEDNYILPTNTILTVIPPPQQLQEQQVHQLASPTSPSTVQQHHQFPPPPQTSSHQAENHDSEELPRSVTCFKDVLLLLKPLEEYAMLKENYRAIGLITQLEGVLINEPESNLGLPSNMSNSSSNESSPLHQRSYCRILANRDSSSSSEAASNSRRRYRRPPYKKVFAEQKRILVKCYEDRKTIAESAKIAGINKYTATSIISSYKKDGKLTIEKRGGRRNKITTEILQKIEQIVEENPCATLKNMQAKIYEHFNINLKSLTLEERIKILRIFDKVPSCSKLAQLLGISYNAIGCIMNNRDEMIENYNKHSKPEESEPLDTIIIPTLMLKIRKEHKPPINPRIIKMIELLGECVCEALKRQQNFSRAWITKRTSEFYDIMQLNHFEFPVYWFQYVRCEYKLRLANKEESLKYATLPVEVDLNEILTFCINKMVGNKNDEAESLENSYSSNNDPQDLIRSFDQSSSLGAKHLQITSYSDVLKMLKPLKDFAALCANNEGLEYISALEQHIKNQ